MSVQLRETAVAKAKWVGLSLLVLALALAPKLAAIAYACSSGDPAGGGC